MRRVVEHPEEAGRRAAAAAERIRARHSTAAVGAALARLFAAGSAAR